MECLRVLEEKLVLLIDRVQAAQKVYDALAEENEQLRKEVSLMQNALREENAKAIQLREERALAEMTVEEMIARVDASTFSENHGHENV